MFTVLVSEVQHLHREKRRLQPHAVLQLQARLLLDVPWRLENARIGVLRMFKVLLSTNGSQSVA